MSWLSGLTVDTAPEASEPTLASTFKGSKMNTFPTSNTASHINRTLFVAGVLAAGLIQAVSAAQPYRPVQDNTSMATRIEVLADLHLWQQATAHLSAEDLYRRSGARFEQASAEYLRLRSSDSYAAEVNRLISEKGETVSLVNQ
jgi:hypothetical protein